MIAVLTTFFNPMKYEAPVRNYWRFRRHLERCHFFACEASFDGEFVTDAAMRIEANENNLMWQKERMINLLIASLPEEFDKIVWTDCDIIYCADNWTGRMESMLDDFPVVQGFDTLDLLDADGCPIDRRLNCVEHHGDVKSSPGGCWGARRDVLPAGKILDNHILGGDDCLQANAWRGVWDYLFDGSPAQVIDYLESAVPHYRNAAGRMGVLRQHAYHLYHGSVDNRDYSGRHRVLVDGEFDPRKDIVVGENGLWEWQTEKRHLVTGVAEYFRQRKEDE